MQDLIAVIQKAIQADNRSLYAIARAAGLRYSVVHRFAKGERTGITIGTVGKLCGVLGLELRSLRRRKRKAVD